MSRKRMLLLVNAAAVELWLSASCAKITYINGACEETSDCDTLANPLPGTICLYGRCACPGKDHEFCCAKGTDPETCDMRCRPFAECALPEDPAPQCETDTDCPHSPVDVCSKYRCIDGKCELDIFSIGERTPSQVRGDCKTSYCSIMGEIVEVEDPSDVYDDGLICTYDVCENGSFVNRFIPDGVDCAGPGSGYCYQGECVECIYDIPSTHCKNLFCDKNYCVPQSCVINNECGGECAPCSAGELCLSPSDCKDHVCAFGMCVQPSCTDFLQNGAETGIDCGGPCENPCTEGQGCKSHSDCVSKVCWAGKCQPHTCYDGTMNGSEAGIDCGGVCGPC